MDLTGLGGFDTAIEFGSVCSGIEAASVAWEPIGWKAVWFAEIEPFPSRVLAHRWPRVPNYGDMLDLPARVARGEIAAPDVLVGGTPCQAFSVAGRRGSLEDERGALTLSYVELANAVDRRRADTGREPCIVVWENVPGVLNTKDNAFGCFLAGLAGETEPLVPAGPRWTNAGCVYGPQRAVAWRVLDAQYFGVAQRRRRVFVVASARTRLDPAAVLFEREGVRRDTPPSREARQDITHDVAPCLTSSGRGVERCGDTRGQDPVVAVPLLEPGARTGKSTTDPRAGIGIGADDDPMFTLQAGKQHGGAVAFGQNRQSGPVDVSHAMNAHSGPHGRLDFESETFLVQAVTGDISHALNTANNGKGCSEDGTGRGVPTIAFQPGNLRRGAGSPPSEDVFPTLKSDHGRGMSDQFPHVATVALNAHENQRAECTLNDTAGAIKCAGGKPGQGYPAVMTVHGTQDPDVRVDLGHTLGRNNGGENALLTGLSVRRLTPRECERLQGFPDGHTRIPIRKYKQRRITALRPADAWEKINGEWWLMAADGPRYKGISNSKAIPCVQWLGRRIAAQLQPETGLAFDLDLDLDDFDWEFGT